MAYIELRRFMQTTFREKAMGALSYLNGLGCMIGILVGAGGAELFNLSGWSRALWTIGCIVLGVYLTSERYGMLVALRWRIRMRYWRRRFLAQTSIDGRQLPPPVDVGAPSEQQVVVVLQDGTRVFEPVRNR